MELHNSPENSATDRVEPIPLNDICQCNRATKAIGRDLCLECQSKVGLTAKQLTTDRLSKGWEKS